MEMSGKLEVSYHREMQQNYLMIAAAEEGGSSFEARMLEENAIEGLLRLRIRREDSRCWFCYEITSRQPLSRLLESVNLGAGQIRSLLLGIARTLVRMSGYLLTEGQILLQPEYIYVDPADFRPQLCLLPGKEGDFPREFSEFLQFLLGKTDHQDQEAVVMIYGLYRESLKENYGLDNLLGWLTGESCADAPCPEATRSRGEALFAGSPPERGACAEGSHERGREEPYPGEFRGRGGKEACPEGSRGGEGKEARAGELRGRRGREPYPAGEEALRGQWKKAFLRGVLLPAAALAVLWLWGGLTAVIRYGFAAAGLSAAAAAAGAVVSSRIRGKRTEPARGGADEPETWEMVFAGEDEPEDREPAAPEEEQSHTVLLRKPAPGGDVRCLAGVEGTTEIIPVSYYPFLIGKQENLSDYVVARDTVSRLHMRVDRRDGQYWLTDLNSTNGTSVNGRMLEANETVPLREGDRVCMADLCFLFQ